ncbi:MAG: Crp/Fnr family transcriptional regulator [Steroidobacteraceae bacterium]
MQTLCVSLPVFQGWIEHPPPLRVAVHRYLARQLRALTDLAVDLALHDTMTRMAQLLLRHFDESTDAKAPKVNLIGDLPQTELASLIGSVRIVVSRLLAELQRGGLLSRIRLRASRYRASPALVTRPGLARVHRPKARAPRDHAWAQWLACAISRFSTRERCRA